MRAVPLLLSFVIALAHRVCFLPLIGSVDNRGSDALEELAATPAARRRVVRYEGALHGLLCEPEARRHEIEREIATWVKEAALTP